MTAVRTLLEREGSTRLVGLMRVGLALLLWTRFAGDLGPWLGPAPERLLVAALFFPASLAMLMGWLSQASTALTGAVLMWMVYGIGPETMEPWVHHHTTLLAHATVLLALTPCGGSYSVDRWVALRRAKRLGRPAPEERGPQWAVLLIAFQLSVVYLSSALDKTTLGFLNGERLQHTLQFLYWGADPVTLPGWSLATMLAAWLVVGLEVALGVGLWFGRARKVLIPVGIAFHLLLYLLIPVATFSLTTILLYLAFLDPDEPLPFEREPTPT